MTNIPEDRIPVIVGIGEIVDRPKEIAEGLEPLDLLEQALRRAEQDAGAKLLGEVQSLDVVNFLSWRYRDPEQLLAQRLGISPAHCYYGPVGGESPIRYIHEAAKRIARGECSVAAVCGAEAQSSATKAERAGVKLPWTPFAYDVEEPKRGAAFQKPLAVKLGVFRPVTVYPFYEAASSAHWGQTPREAMAESGTLWSRYSEAAAENPNAWLKRRYTPEEITTPTADNRLIAWPYNKLMVANPSVNMGGALLLTSLAKARAAGIAEDKLVYPLGGASAEEPRDYLLRDQFYESHPQNAVLKAAMDLAGGDGKSFDAIELYSCFPCVPKMARRTLGLGADVQPTVTGGLTFFGAPLNTYMTHAACAMVRRLRDGAKLGLLYGQGGFVTKHHALVVSKTAPREALVQETSVQADADRNKRAVPEFVAEATGKGTVESFTVLYGRGGNIEHGVVMLRTEDDRRTLARVPASDGATLAQLLAMDRTPVGSFGEIAMAEDNVPEWRVA
ncbi:MULTISPECIES: acetyl-CoA acetyltransferase [Bradyrhizobium]|uniref:acetyl-CoA acetyltransferase n=1 Tax=Bradyrhizobium TaxID=374 RepID=UPI001CD42386|nr:MULTISPECIES: acetyl-CoA acetyltransferase [unclassified Bradyrhizobium]MCA1424774.1 acetyl-CoA acetyltransferase [Bradyrhizobium sp. NBAIM16]MCA1496473.1 acetyl-CoA acetyltransferase [Bradyrhizobium sp. NBAIM14]MCA1502620.1 acetyl-CoA acetyltransferase [Bradyrhizobium sp. NBAIM02]MCA1509474.1 acetyl-CoA acetyltransferase [Bradyrhizobium sp. NBAIM01]MCA1535659.1 acetyl-CoA acetyltransferase [Bradyrhizobium sp. NBAIM03]